MTGQWVIYALSRRKRPRDILPESSGAERLPAYDESCPFCPGNEGMLTPIILEYKASAPSWQLRVVANKFAALTPEGELRRERNNLYVSLDGYGHHEVVIESRLHNMQIPMMAKEEVETIIESYHRRYVDLMNLERNLMIVIFRNYGFRAGASLVHPHSQIISTGVAPLHVRTRDYRSQNYFDEWGRCIYCDILLEELSAGSRIVHENNTFISFVPFAAEQPFEIWIMPRKHKADFGNISDEEKADLASALLAILQKLASSLNNPDYNYVVHSCMKYRSGEPHLHWFLQVRPRLMTSAGFEIGSGMSINTDLPEDDAAFLRTGN